MKILSILNENPEKYGFNSEKFKASQNEKKVLKRIGMERGYKTTITTTRGNTKKVQVTGVGDIVKGVPQIQVRILDGKKNKKQEFAIPFTTFKAEYAKYKEKLAAQKQAKGEDKAEPEKERAEVEKPREGSWQAKEKARREYPSKIAEDMIKFASQSDQAKRKIADLLANETIRRMRKKEDQAWEERK